MVQRPSSGGSHGNEPPEFCCPISDEIMVDPVVLVQTGQTFDRKSIQNWFSRGETTCPLTGDTLESIQLTPNYALKALIQQWRDRQPSVSGQQNGGTHYPKVQGSMYPILAVDGQPQDKIAQVHAALAKLRSPSMDLRSYREQRVYDLWTLSELMLDPYCSQELMGQEGFPPVLRFLTDGNSEGCYAAAARIVQRLAMTPAKGQIYSTTAQAGGIERLVSILGEPSSAKKEELSSREAAAWALRELAAVSRQSQEEILFQLCARSKQIQGPHSSQLSFVVPLNSLLHVPATSETAAAAGLLAQLTLGMQLQNYAAYSSCAGTAAVQSLVDLLGSSDDSPKRALISLLYTSNQMAIIFELVQSIAGQDWARREAAGLLLWEVAAANTNLVGVLNQIATLAAAIEAALRARSVVGAGLVQLMTCDHAGFSNSVVAPPNTDAIRLQLVSHEQVLPSLVQLLYSNDQMTAQAAVHALANLTAFRSAANVDSRFAPLRRTTSNCSHHPSSMVADSMAVSRLVGLLNCPDAAIVAPAVALLNNLCAENDNRDKVKEAARQGGMDRLRQRLEELMAWGLLSDKIRAAARTSLQRLLGGKMERSPAQYAYITLLMRPPTHAS